MEPKEKLKTLPELPLKLIFNDLSFQDIMNLVKTPEFRKMIKDFYQRDMNQKLIIEKVFTEIIYEFIGCNSKNKNKTPDIIIHELEKYLIRKGMMNYKESDEYKLNYKSFLNNLLDQELFSISPDNFRRMTKDEFMDFVVKNIKKDRVLDEVFENADRERSRKLNYLLASHDENEYNLIRCMMQDFINDYIKDPKNGFRNLLEIIEIIPNLFTFDKKSAEILRKVGINEPLRKLELIEKIFPSK